MKNLPVDELIKLISKDDQRAFDVFYHRYYKQIFRYIYYRLLNMDSCKEVISTVFFSLWKSRKQLTNVKSIESYLFTIARNEIKSFQAHSITDTVSLEDIPIQLEIEPADNPEELIITEEIRSLLSASITNLPEKCRVIFMMSRNDGLNSVEIAKKLGLSENTVRVQLKIAVEKITDQIKKYYPHMLTLISFSCLCY
jgi:RNA polymerase sigma factor, sigma-70 family